MNNILELKRPIDIINPELDKYDAIDSFPEKTQRARENIAKYGLPKEWQEEYDKIIREKSFWIDGILQDSLSLVGSFQEMNQCFHTYLSRDLQRQSVL